MPSFEDPQIPFKVLVLGGSYAGLAAALNLVDLCHGRRCRFDVDAAGEGPGKTIPVQVTIVDERDGYYHLIGIPLAIASQKCAERFWSKYTDIPALQTSDIRCVQGSIGSIDCQSKTATINTAKGSIHEPYDYLITCTGLRRDWPSTPRSFTKEKYLAETAEGLSRLDDASQGVVVIGGGAVGIEIASELKTLHPHLKITLIHSRSALLSSEPLPDEFRSRALELLRSCSVDLLLGVRVGSTTQEPGKAGYTLTLSDNTTINASYVINAVSRSTPTAPRYLPASVCDEQGYVRITPQLQFDDASLPNAGDHYAAGDIARWSGIKRAGAAMHQGHYAARNIHQKMMQKVYGKEPEFVTIAEVEPMMGLAVGETAVGYFPATGLSEGETVRQMFFQDDLGFMTYEVRKRGRMTNSFIAEGIVNTLNDKWH
ncbi:hypothetical protein P175DRAFT_0555981 [Aspergillus ochraceoroseus IBT 24754]|uniref:FAD/NAD(P)-binding domain-containing protein n=1 Tax=Aspergillus ochraceoroseus IBT 24754 TaxID=1392256 RepID=A0A2T5M489_9EURO|nr:uncharacterized protein P175DRAFT_0555981 [Aspergillus ochraceoroseus IBT 24754]PTU23334.1 hypothetical protein P175DRAFT_0555981 [Aspergillus ochraceoroseus IBT 24754]